MQQKSMFGEEPEKECETAVNSLQVNACLLSANKRAELAKLLRQMADDIEPPRRTKKEPEESFTTRANWIAQCFNDATGGRTRITTARMTVIRQRLKDEFWAANWQEALERACGIPGLNGVNDRGWKFTFDWFIRPDSVAKIMEGTYDNWKRPLNKAEQREQGNADAFAAFLATCGEESSRIGADPSTTLFLEEHSSTDFAPG